MRAILSTWRSDITAIWTRLDHIPIGNLMLHHTRGTITET